MNYKKSILSLVTILALNNAVLADPNATYLPLTNKTNDNAWIMFGVNDFSSGVATPPASDGTFSAGFSQVTEVSTSDDLASPSAAIIANAAAGTMFQDSTGAKNMATFQALKDSSGAPLIPFSLVMAINTIDTTFSETQPIRSMYISLEGAPSVPKIKLNYKSTLEGQDVEIQIGGTGTVYKTKISETATFNSPAVAQDVTAISDEAATAKPEDVLAYDLSASPVIASAYSKLNHQGTNAGTERFYHYDAVNAQWILWDRSKVAETTNTLTHFERGKAYWGKFDIDNGGDTNSTTKAGLYLGKTGLKEADAAIYTGKLTSGSWNMMSFDPADHQDIRNSVTGLIVDATNAENNHSIIIMDETGVNELNVTLATQHTGATEEIAKQINEAIEAAKILGDIPDTFNVKAFASDNADVNITFLSDRRFTIKDGSSDSFGASLTLAGGIVTDTNTSVDANATVQGNLPVTGVTSKYGEYAMIIEPLVGSGTASILDYNLSDAGGIVGSAAVMFGNIDGDSQNGATTATPLALAGNNVETTIALAKTAFQDDDVFNNEKSKGLVTEIDTNFDGASDMLLVAADKPFYVKDNTFTRVYAVDATKNGTGSVARTTPNLPFNISPADQVTVLTPADADGAAEIAALINGVADHNSTAKTGVYAAVDGTKLVVVTKGSKVFEIEDAASATVDYFSKSASDADIAKGAVKRIVNIANLVRKNLVTNKVEIKFTADAANSELDSNVSISTWVRGVSIVPAAFAIIAETRTDTTILAMLKGLVDNLNTALKTAKSAAFASHNYIGGWNDISRAIITIDGIDINGTTFNETNTTLATAPIADANSATAGTINVDAALIVSDLKANAVYTPDYVNSGPLYTLKSAGYEAKAIIRASTKLATIPTTHWDHIDLTRAPKDWLKNNEYNLFNVDNSAGYWVYVEDYTPANDISDGTTVWSPSFAHHFNTKTGATENLLNSASFSVEITDGSATGGTLDAETSNAKLIIGANEVQLTKTGTTFTAVLTEPETDGLTPNSGSDLSIRLMAADGLGESYSKSALISFDYDKPVAPLVTASNGMEFAFSSTSADVASYYIWKDYIPDNGNSLTPVETKLSTADAGAYNICPKSAFKNSTDYKIIAFDGTGVFGKANASNITGFRYENTLKGATVLTHNKGDATSSVVSYDSVTCLANDTATKSGVEVKAVQVGKIVVSYQAISGTTNNKDDLPLTAFYEIADATDDVLQIDILPDYAGKDFYLEYNGVLYTSVFPVDQVAADASFSDALNLTAVNSANQSLD